jgi:hypothetical protein
MPCKPRFVCGVKRHVSESIKLNPGKPRLVAGSFTWFSAKNLLAKTSKKKGSNDAAPEKDSLAN